LCCTLSNDFTKDFLSIELNRYFEPEKREPLIKVFNYYDNMINDQTIAINTIKESFEEYKNIEIDRKIEIKKDCILSIFYGRINYLKFISIILCPKGAKACSLGL